MATEKVSFYNPESDTIIEVSLSSEDAQRAQNDLSFATAVMNASVQKEETQEETDAQITDDGEEGSVYRWTTPCVLLLLETYKNKEEKFNNGKQSQKKVWEEVSAIMLEKNIKVTGPQCAAKLRSLKKSYKSVKNQKSKSGNDRRTWQFYEIMDSIFSKKAAALASSSRVCKGLCMRADDALSSPSTNTCDVSSTSTSASIKTNILLTKRMRQKEEHEEAKAKRHKERMEMDKKLLKILEKIANK